MCFRCLRFLFPRCLLNYLDCFYVAIKRSLRVMVSKCWNPKFSTWNPWISTLYRNSQLIFLQRRREQWRSIALRYYYYFVFAFLPLSQKSTVSRLRLLVCRSLHSVMIIWMRDTTGVGSTLKAYYLLRFIFIKNNIFFRFSEIIDKFLN